MDECGIYGVVLVHDTLNGVLKGSDTIQGQLKAQGMLVGKVGFPKCQAWQDEYEGDYDVIPKTYMQTLDTDNKVLRDEVRVHEIPYYETSNVDGVTVYIGNEL